MAKTMLVLLDDLLFQVKIADAANRAGLAATFLSDAEVLIDRAQQDPPAAILVDLNLSKADPIATIRSIRSTGEIKRVPLIGYVSHVQTALRAAAVEAGCDRVLARSAFVQNLPELLRELLTSPPAMI